MCILIPSLAWGEPSIVFETEQHDLGTVVQGRLLEYAFVFSNVGTDDLIIKRISPT